MNIYHAEKGWGEYLTLATDTKLNICFSILHPKMIWLVCSCNNYLISGCKSSASYLQVNSKGCSAFE